MQVLSEGQCIKHDQYGYGIVAESDGERTTIDFDSVGMKKFVTGLMAMELVGEAPEQAYQASASQQESRRNRRGKSRRSRQVVFATRNIPA